MFIRMRNVSKGEFGFMKKEVYTTPEIEVIEFEAEDIITSSIPLDDDETAIIPNLIF